MKKLLVLVFATVLSLLTANAQKDVTKFLGIPVDGTKAAMIQKLKNKGFRYNVNKDVLTGEFNGNNVELSVVTNRNKVWRIVVHDASWYSESDIKIRFNNLCQQFDNNSKYSRPSLSDYKLTDEDDISYGISVENKRYQAAYWQKPDDIDATANRLSSDYQEKYGDEKFKDLTDEEKKQLISDMLSDTFKVLEKKSVWFMIHEQYGRYKIIMYYDNEYNHSNGEDL